MMNQSLIAFARDAARFDHDYQLLLSSARAARRKNFERPAAHFFFRSRIQPGDNDALVGADANRRVGLTNANGGQTGAVFQGVHGRDAGRHAQRNRVVSFERAARRHVEFGADL